MTPGAGSWTRRRRLVAGVAVLLGIPAYVACYAWHVCMAGHARHGPYPAWHAAVDAWWIGCFVCAGVLGFTRRGPRKLLFLLAPPVLLICRLALPAGLEHIELAALAALAWGSIGALLPRGPRPAADPSAVPLARSRRPGDCLPPPRSPVVISLVPPRKRWLGPNSWLSIAILLALAALTAAGSVRFPRAPLRRVFGAHDSGSYWHWVSGALRGYCFAQGEYHLNDWDDDGERAYSASLAPLRETIDDSGNPINLIDSALAAAEGWAGIPRLGLLFRAMSTIAGQPIDWSTDFALCATPAIYGQTGYYTFIVKTDGTIWSKDLGCSAFVGDFPADPERDDWVAEN